MLFNLAHVILSEAKNPSTAGGTTCLEYRFFASLRMTGAGGLIPELGCYISSSRPY